MMYERVLIFVLVVVLGITLYELRSASVELVSVKAIEKERRDAANKEEIKVVKQELEHNANVKEATTAFNTKSVVLGHRSDADYALVERLRLKEERRAATYRAQASAYETVCSGLADQLESFDRHIVEGTKVVAGLREHLGRRDNEVVLLHEIMAADRVLLAPNQ